MTVDSLEGMHQFIIARIYHEDILLAQRTYNFLTLSVFLGAVLVAVPAESPSLRTGLCILGLILSAVHIAMGRTLERTLVYWRLLIREVEARLGWARDASMYDFFDFCAVMLPDGARIQPMRNGVLMDPATQGRSWLKRMTMNLLTGVFLPSSVALVWCAFLGVTQGVWSGVAVTIGLVSWIACVLRWSRIPELGVRPPAEIMASAKPSNADRAV